VFLVFPSLLTYSGFKSVNDLSPSLIKSQTLTPFSVAAETHYNLGLNPIELMVEPASKLLIGYLRSVTSHKLSFLSLPPVAKYFPFGEMATQLT